MSEPDDEPRSTTLPDLSGLVTTAAGLVSYGIAEARKEVKRLPVHAIRLPLVALNFGLSLADRALREYTTLRGGNGAQPAEDEPAPPPTAPVADFVQAGTQAAAQAATAAADRLEQAVARVRPPQPRDEPATDAGRAGRRDTAASDPVRAQVAETAEAERAARPLAHEDLPLPNFDHMTLGSLRGRLRTLDTAQLVLLRDYEKAHADRLPVVTMLDNRIAKLAAQTQP